MCRGGGKTRRAHREGCLEDLDPLDRSPITRPRFSRAYRRAVSAPGAVRNRAATRRDASHDYGKRRMKIGAGRVRARSTRSCTTGVVHTKRGRADARDTIGRWWCTSEQGSHLQPRRTDRFACRELRPGSSPVIVEDRQNFSPR